MIKPNLNWTDRFALIDRYTPSDIQIVRTFGLTQDELDTARSLRSAGTFAMKGKIDVAKMGNVFIIDGGVMPITSQNGSSVTMTPMRTTKILGQGKVSYVRPESVNKKPKVPQKRGRKGDKIPTALAAVPRTPVLVTDFIKQYGVSLPVLRQSKRFIDKFEPKVAATIGHIKVRQDKVTKLLMIWQEDRPVS